MYRSLLALILFVFFLAVPDFAESEKSNDPILSASPGKSIIGRSLPPGTYRVIPDLRPGQREASISVTLVEVDSGKPSIPDQSEIGEITEPVKTDIPQTQTNSPQDKKQEDPSGTGPEYDCEYGLPRRDGANGELQLTPGDLPAGLHLDDFANFNKACEVHQWIMHGSDRKNRIEVNISVWGDRAKSYYNWKHGMLATGEFNQLYIPPARAGHAMLGTQQLYVEEKASCNKQLIMQVGNYLVEMHRPSVEGLTQQADPISKEKFEALAKACESRIAAVAGIPDKQMLNDNPAEFRWGITAVWPVSFVNGILKVQGAGKPKWGTKWVTVDSGIKSYRGQGTGAGPVVTYTKDNKRWTIVTLNHNTGGRGNIRIFDTRVSIMKAGEHGATLRVGGTCYDYSWNHLEEINCETGQFIYVSNTIKNAGVDEPGKDPEIPDKKTPEVNVPPTIKVPPGPDCPDWVWDLDLEIMAGTPSESCSKYFDRKALDGDPWWIFDYGEDVLFKVIDRNTGRDFPAVFDTMTYNSKKKLGTFNGNVFHATDPGQGIVGIKSLTITYVPKGGIKRKTKVIPYQYYGRSGENFNFHVNPPLEIGMHWPDNDALVLDHSFVFYEDSVKPIDDVGVVIQGENTPEVALGTTAFHGWLYRITYGELRKKNIPRGIYTVYAYKRDKDLPKDLWPDRKYQIAIPPIKGQTWKLRIFMKEAGQKWNNYNLDEPNKRLNQ